jgi:hypothetical protein
MKTIVIGDVHGQIDLLRSFMRSQNLIDENDERIDTATRVISVGDLVDASTKRWHGDEQTIAKADKWFDKVCIGNHEKWVFDKVADTMEFTASPLLAPKLNALERDGIYVPGVVEQDWLITHAGVGSKWDFKTPEEALVSIYECWLDNQHLWDLIEDVGPGRKGRDEQGGILWHDWDEPWNPHFNQIVGHTPIPSGPTRSRDKKTGAIRWNVDLGAKGGKGIGAVVIEGGRATPIAHSTTPEITSTDLLPV